MFNDFVLVGPKSDPAGMRGERSAPQALKRIAEAKQPFASRGDDSGTHRTELRLWKAAGIEVSALGSSQAGRAADRSSRSGLAPA